ncbi:LrgB family protein [Glaciecola sp. 2405UD65-10]|uniref:LrgB family protein n=1 Tax=Glaciecola sp. 2405UD65-10 TaxID=3397244 RepID=UPI003B597DE2
MWILESAAWVIGTIVTYLVCVRLYQLSRQFPLFHPLIVCTLLIIVAMYVMQTSIAQYQQHTYLLTFLLGPATVALAVPLYHQSRILLAMNWRVVLPIVIAGIVAPCLSWISVYLLNAPLDLQMTVMVKSITTPLAMDTAALISGIPALAAVMVISTGIVGAVCGPSLFKILKVYNHAAQGTALGAVAHAIGTAKAFSISEQCAAFATLALCLNGIMTAILLPVLFA